MAKFKKKLQVFNNILIIEFFKIFDQIIRTFQILCRPLGTIRMLHTVCIMLFKVKYVSWDSTFRTLMTRPTKYGLLYNLF
jgi:hypothetical protein